MAVSGGPQSDVIFLCVLTTVFFAISYTRGPQAWLFAMTCAAYLLLVLGWHAGTPVAAVVVRLGTLATVWFMVAYLSQERNAQLSAYLSSQELAEHRAELLRAVARTAASITILDADRVMDEVTTSLIDLGFDVCNFDVLEEGARTYRVSHARGLPEAFTEAVHPAAMGIPVFVDGQPEAVLVAARLHTRHLPAPDIEVVEILATQVGRALENAKRFRAEHDVAEAASLASLRDELTGVGNRRQANLMLERLRPGDALVLIDLDHFKEVNDRDGHAAGDKVLRVLGQHLRDAVRDGDDVARYGGEEFLLLLRRAGAEAF